MKAILFSALVAALTATADAWWCNGHMLTAEIARKNLKDGIEEKITPAIQFMNQVGGFVQSPDMVQAACWADDLKKQGITVMEGWHYIDQPVTRGPFPVPTNAFPYNDNVATELENLVKSARNYKVNEKQWAIGYTIMNMLHFYGDIHQPLHTVTLYSQEFPTGDMVGNLFKVSMPTGNACTGCTELHAVWDSVCTKYPQDLPRPLSASNQQYIQQQAQMLMSANPNVPRPTEYNFTRIAQEGKQYAITNAYADLQSGQQVTQAYLDQCAKIAEIRLVQGGMRLASELNYIFHRHRDDTGLARLHTTSPQRARLVEALRALHLSTL